MLIGSIYGWEIGRDDLFDPQSSRNRDDCLEPMRVMREYAYSRGIELHTEDVLHKQGIKPDFSLYMESIPMGTQEIARNYLIRFETPLTVPINQNRDYLEQFDGIFTWDLDLLEGKSSDTSLRKIPKEKFTEIRTPNSQSNKVVNGAESPIPDYSNRSIFCCLIASNRHANLPDQRELYSERAKIIRWFEKHHPEDFRLYGNGWKVPEKRFGKLGKLRYRLEKVTPFLLKRPVFSSYQGPTKTKQEVLLQSKFCICFENARDIRGYLTEKIFDSLFAGCIPVYWGEPDIEQWIPNECFIDFRNFSSHQELYDFIYRMTPERFHVYQAAGQEFLGSEAFKIHSSQAFAEQIINRIANDFRLSQ